MRSESMMEQFTKSNVYPSIFLFCLMVSELSLCTANIHQMLDCKKSKYGCCPDEVTDALGWNQKGCSALLCYDKDKLCKKLKEEGDCKALDRWQEMNELCPKTCGRCANGQKLASPPACYKSKFGCCYDGMTPAISDDKRPGVGCPFCHNVYRHACKQFGSKYYCKSRQPYTRHFIKHYCFRQCGICTNFKEIVKPEEKHNWRMKFF